MITLKDLSFENNDTCILTIEIERLRVWFEQIINDSGSSRKKEISFMEPNLSFRYSESILQIVLKYDFNPLITYTITPKDELDNEYIVELSKDELISCNVLTDLEILVKKYPVKGNPQ